ncbi:MAG: amidohydrolase [Hyphomonadaceae bacterium]
MLRAISLAALLGALATPAFAQEQGAGFSPEVEAQIETVLPRLIAWRRDIHQNPELGNRETRTAALVARHLRSLRLDEVRTGVAHTGVVGVLRTGRPGPTIALRADMDALPVTEQVDVPFRSRVRTQYNGEEVGVMHACGHDTHTAILMATAEVLARRRDELNGTIVFIFQPAEEGAPQGEQGGAELMLEEGLFRDLQPDAVYGLHASNQEGGVIFAGAGGMMASADSYRIFVRGRQTHASRPHQGLDPITTAAQIIQALQLIPSRQIDAVNTPVVISVGQIRGGIRSNIIPDEVEMWGTLRALNTDAREDAMERIQRTAQEIASASGASAEVVWDDGNYPVLNNDSATTARGVAAIQRALGADSVRPGRPVMGAEDFSFFANEVPGFYFAFGVNAPGVTDAASNHSPLFYVHEPAMEAGLRGLLAVTLDRVGADASAD